MEKIEFLAALDDSPSAIKFDGSGDGGKVTLQFDRSQVLEVSKLLDLAERLLRITVEVERLGTKWNIDETMA